MRGDDGAARDTARDTARAARDTARGERHSARRPRRATRRRPRRRSARDDGAARDIAARRGIRRWAGDIGDLRQSVIRRVMSGVTSSMCEGWHRHLAGHKYSSCHGRLCVCGVGVAWALRLVAFRLRAFELF